MTAEEAITCLKGVNEYRKERTVLKMLNISDRNGMAFSMAIKALEKQIPKKPKEEFDTDLCPYCEGALIYYLDHCHMCGQAIKWEEENEIKKDQ